MTLLVEEVSRIFSSLGGTQLIEGTAEGLGKCIMELWNGCRIAFSRYTFRISYFVFRISLSLIGPAILH